MSSVYTYHLEYMKIRYTVILTANNEKITDLKIMDGRGPITHSVPKEDLEKITVPELISVAPIVPVAQIAPTLPSSSSFALVPPSSSSSSSSSLSSSFTQLTPQSSSVAPKPIPSEIVYKITQYKVLNQEKLQLGYYKGGASDKIHYQFALKNNGANNKNFNPSINFCLMYSLFHLSLSINDLRQPIVSSFMHAIIENKFITFLNSPEIQALLKNIVASNSNALSEGIIDVNTDAIIQYLKNKKYTYIINNLNADAGYKGIATITRVENGLIELKNVEPDDKDKNIYNILLHVDAKKNYDAKEEDVRDIDNHFIALKLIKSANSKQKWNAHIIDSIYIVNEKEQMADQKVPINREHDKNVKDIIEAVIKIIEKKK
jgi:hypothetical protein